MRISYHTHAPGLDLTQGFGTAGFNIVNSLKKLGHEVPFNDPSADVILNFTQPPYYQFHKNQYNIGYTPWESSDVEPGWLAPMMAVDELWVPTPMVASWFHNAGATRDIKVFEHGINHSWEPYSRRRRGPLKFLHVGADSVRKGGQDVFDAFIEAFGKDNPNVQLTFKTHHPWLTIRRYEGNGLLYTPLEYSSNIRHIAGEIDLEDMIDLFNSHDVFVYPSYGEGFGLLPLQALATGMPTITTTSWCSYSRFINSELSISSLPTDSPWPLEHPGQVYMPSQEDIINAMLTAYNNWDSLNGEALDIAPIVHEEYDWLRLTEQAFAPVIDKMNSK